MGKTLIAEAGIYEAMKTGTKAYYTTPLIALTEQKYRTEISGGQSRPRTLGMQQTLRRTRCWQST